MDKDKTHAEELDELVAAGKAEFFLIERDEYPSYDEFSRKVNDFIRELRWGNNYSIIFPIDTATGHPPQAGPWGILGDVLIYTVFREKGTINSSKAPSRYDDDGR